MVHFTVTRVAALSMMRSFKKQQKQETLHTRGVTVTFVLSFTFLTCPFLEQGNVNFFVFGGWPLLRFVLKAYHCVKRKNTEHNTHKEYTTSGG